MQKSLLFIFFLLSTASLCLASDVSYDEWELSDPEFTSSACRGQDSSAIKFVVSGRPAPYNFTWMELGTTSTMTPVTLSNDIDSINITGLDGSLDYVVIVTDDMNAVLCQDTFRFSSMGLLAAQLTQNATSMCAASATAQVFIGPNVVVDPANNQYDFLWNNGETTQTAVGLASGPVSALVTSPEGCTANPSFVVAGPANPLTVSNPVITTPTCVGGDDGMIMIDISGGNPNSSTTPYIIQWSTGAADNFRNPLNKTENPITSGVYSVTVTDNDMCQVIRSYTIPEPIPVDIDGFTNIAQSTCTQGACDGRAEVQISGGTNPGAGYQIAWLNGETTATATMLCAGMNIVDVSNSGCPSVTDTVFITSPNDVSVALIDSTNTRCFQQADGTIEVVGNGGTPGYSYSWDHSASGSPSQNSLLAGTYTVIATDSRGCTSDPRPITITEPDSMEVVVDLGGTLNPRCNGDNNGVLSTRWIRGGNMSTTPNYTWSANTPNPPNEPIATGLSAGTYSVTVTDGNGCQDETSFTLTTPPELIGRMTMPLEPECFGDLTTVTVDTAIGGTGTSFTFSVNNGPQQQLRNPNEVLAGTQIVSVFDRNACRWDTTIIIDQPTEVTVDIIDEITIDLGDSAQLMPIIPMSVMIDSIIWTPEGNLTCADCLAPWVIPTRSATYEVTVVDINGCRGSDQVRVDLNKARNIYVPNAFSPNGDGINDYFQMGTGTGVNRINYLKIFNRWGELLYEQEDYLPAGGTDGWNGEFRGRDQNMGTYVFVSEVLFQDNTTLIYRGAVNLVR